MNDVSRTHNFTLRKHENEIRKTRKNQQRNVNRYKKALSYCNSESFRKASHGFATQIFVIHGDKSRILHIGQYVCVLLVLLPRETSKTAVDS